MARTRLDAMAVHEHSGRRTWKDAAILAAALAFFLFVIAYCVVTDYDYYITDSVAFILLTLFLYVFYRRLHRNLLFLYPELPPRGYLHEKIRLSWPRP